MYLEKPFLQIHTWDRSQDEPTHSSTDFLKKLDWMVSAKQWFACFSFSNLFLSRELFVGGIQLLRYEVSCHPFNLGLLTWDIGLNTANSARELEQTGSKIPALRAPFRLCVWAFELLLVLRIARLFQPTLRVFYVAWSYPSLKSNSYYYNVLTSQHMVSWLYIWLELLNSAVS